ncbi:MAG TPA: tRNA lysidine(34) synthetase TilS [Thermoanaerobaculia bacterium]|nr:tRNA lysidine(34) synthetase TilS [Thermoanaerobaculia bacterium]
MRSDAPEPAVSRAFEAGDLPRAGVVLAAVSGGPDSMALLAALAAVAPAHTTVVVAAHVDHGWRGERSRRDAEFVARWCARQHLEFLSERLPSPPRGRSREEAARDLRYRALAAMRERVGASVVATGHTRDDAAETVLLALLRGRPLAGIAGIRRRREDGVVRPLLDVSRPSIMRYLRDRRIPYRRDATNDDPSFDRNWVRRRVVPLLERRFGDAVTANLAASAEALSRDREWMEELFARDVLPKLGDDDSVRAEAALLAALPAAALRRALLAMAHRAAARPLSRAELLALEKLARSGAPFRFQAGRCVDFRSRGGVVTARRTM